MKKLLTDRVDRFAGTKVAVWCDLVLDEFLYGRISRISREAPVLILDYDHRSTMPGGGANAIENLRALGAVPLPVGVIGRDDAGDRLMAWMEASGIDTTGVARVPDYTTPSKSRVLAGLPHCRPQQILRIDRGAPRELPVDAAVERLRAILSGEEVRALLISDYGYGIITPESAGPILAEARRLGIPAACDSRHRLKRFQGVTAATPNLEEAEEILGERLGDDPSRIVDAGRRLVEILACRAVLVTRGSRGMTLLEDGMKPFHLPVYGGDEVADVTGAGDTVIATFTLAMATGATFLQAALLANCAAGLVVMKRGTATVPALDLKAAIETAAPTVEAR